MGNTDSSESFVNWLALNLQAIRDGSAMFNGERVTVDSVVTQYELCYSILILTSKKRSSFLLMGTPEQKRTVATYTLLTLLFGWWGIPWGFIWSPAIIANNLFGGIKLTVGQLISFLENPEGSPLPDVGFGKAFGMWVIGLIGSYAVMFGVSHVIAYTAIFLGHK